MVLLDVQIQEMLGWKILSTFQTPIRVGLVVMYFVALKRWEGERLSVGWKRAFHLNL